jgi:hypothetical protein
MNPQMKMSVLAKAPITFMDVNALFSHLYFPDPKDKMAKRFLGETI